MWIFTEGGRFVSAVADRNDPNLLVIRGRLKGDVEAVFPGYAVETTPDADYRFRARVGRVEAATRIAAMLASVQYDNFKNTAPHERHGFLMSIWTVLRGEQDKAIPKRQKKREWRARQKAWNFGRRYSAPQINSETDRWVWDSGKDYDDPEDWAGLPLTRRDGRPF